MKPLLLSFVLFLAACLLLAPSVHAEDAPAARPPLYGLYCWAGGYLQYADDIHKVGLRSLRVGGWHDKDTADKAALLAAANGVALQPILGLGELSHARTLPLDQAVEKYRSLTRDAVARYGPGGSLWKENPNVKPLPIRTWQIWNEPNIEFLNPDGAALLRTEFYAKLLTAASEEIRKLDPAATIIAFNTAGGCPYQGRGVPPDGMFQKLKYIGWRKFIRDVATEVGQKSFDAIGTHPYSQPAGPEGHVDKGLEMIRELFTELRFTKDIYFTEVGYPVEYPNNLAVRDAAQQAAFTVRLFAISAAHGVTQVQIMFVEDIVYGPDSTRRSFGFFTAPGVWRDQATATRVMIKLIPDPRQDAKVLMEEPDGVWAYQFTGVGGLPIVMAWNAGKGTVEKEIPIPNACVQVDMVGKVILREVAPKDARTAKVQLSETPMYFISQPNYLEPHLTIDELLKK